MRLRFATEQIQDVRAMWLRRSSSVLMTRRGDAMALLDPGHERYFTLNEVGSHVWSLLETPTTVSRIVESIRAAFEIPSNIGPERVEHDVVMLLEHLRQLGLVVSEGTLREVR